MTPFPYRIQVRWSDEDGAYVGEVPSFPGAGGDGSTMEEAIARTQESARELIAVAQQHGDPLPSPDVEEPAFSGQIRLRMPKSMHRALAIASEREGVSLNQYMVALLSAEMQRQPVGRFVATAYSLAVGETVLSTAVKAVTFARILVAQAAVFRGGVLPTAVTSEPMALKA
jgi:antitoxin HicB